MPKIDVSGWDKDKARRAERIAQGLCPMCGNPKRAEDDFCTDACQQGSSQGKASQ